MEKIRCLRQRFLSVYANDPVEHGRLGVVSNAVQIFIEQFGVVGIGEFILLDVRYYMVRIFSGGFSIRYIDEHCMLPLYFVGEG